MKFLSSGIVPFVEIRTVKPGLGVASTPSYQIWDHKLTKTAFTPKFTVFIIETNITWPSGYGKHT